MTLIKKMRILHHFIGLMFKIHLFLQKQEVYSVMSSKYWGNEKDKWLRKNQGLIQRTLIRGNII